MAKFTKRQEQGYKETLARVRKVKNEMIRNIAYWGKRGTEFVITDVKIPTMKELRKMEYGDAINLMSDLRNIKKPWDLVKRKQEDSSIIASVYEVKQFKRMARQSEKAKAERRERLLEEGKAGFMGSEYSTTVEPKEYDFEKMSQRDFENAQRRLAKETSFIEQSKRHDLYISNYKKAVSNVFGGFDDEYITLIDTLAKLIDADEFDYITATDDSLEIDFVYDIFADASSRYEDWKDAIKGYIEKYSK